MTIFLFDILILLNAIFFLFLLKILWISDFAIELLMMTPALTGSLAYNKLAHKQEYFSISLRWGIFHNFSVHQYEFFIHRVLLLGPSFYLLYVLFTVKSFLVLLLILYGFWQLRRKLTIFAIWLQRIILLLHLEWLIFYII